MRLKTTLLFLFTLFVASNLWAAEPIKPFVLAKTSDQPMDAVLAETQRALAAVGFAEAGLVSPYEGVRILVVTSPALKEMAAQSMHGAFGAMLRVSLTQVGETVQVAYTNYPYWHAAYRMSGDPAPIAETIQTALGAQEEFGPAEGLTPEALRKYHYKVFMPYFDDLQELAEYDSQQAALDAVEAGLVANAGGVGKVYRIDLPGKDETVFGVTLSQKSGGDAYIMSEIDFKELKSSAHLPYDFIVSDGKVLALSAKFRIAISFPDLSMMGDNSFMNIMDAPDDIENALKAVAKGK
ncbi:MAG: hypothetical protein RRB13_14075 [bacterium]|nr:hypothetical protein [bacterium]